MYTEFEVEKQRLVDTIDQKLSFYMNEVEHKILKDAMSYSLLGKGKRIRPLLVFASAKIPDYDEAEILPFACALECIHTYSLIHDDLPAMDNDSFRRGKPTNHKQFGESTAILAGDALLNLAFEIMSRECFLDLKKEKVYAMSVIAKAAGMNGMIGGQISDIEYEYKIADESALLYIVRRKTGKLFESACVAGAALAGKKQNELNKIETAAKKLGEAFQIKDDILDIAIDAKNNKNTYVSVLGLEQATERFYSISGQAKQELCEIYGEDSFIASLADKLTERTF